ncbi:MAG: ribbon-helix-helix domain-containing protein [Thermosphaera sp.]
MPPRGWRSISIPDELYQLIERAVHESKQYRSVSDFVIDAIRIRLRELGYLK